MNKIKKTEKQIEKKTKNEKKKNLTRVLKGLFFFLFALHFFFSSAEDTHGVRIRHKTRKNLGPI